ncbi:hypothetical protein [Methanimicrococcus hacksteinii]|uniref:hypothetical protein n=1 Tax=Methanimicrococcus hacksteinii TaxID=3028293 RepID=UPI00298F34A6|nr:hypothetical protein [Methanimicrococcus sp. At1]
MQNHIASHHITPYHIASHRITSHHTESHRITQNHIASHRITSHHTESHRITSHHTASRTMPYRITPHTSGIIFNFRFSEELQLEFFINSALIMP